MTVACKITWYLPRGTGEGAEAEMLERRNDGGGDTGIEPPLEHLRFTCYPDVKEHAAPDKLKNPLE